MIPSTRWAFLLVVLGSSGFVSHGDGARLGWGGHEVALQELQRQERQGQEPQGQERQGEVRGVAVDRATGRPLPGVAVEFVGGRGQVATDAAGRFVLRDVPVGIVTLRASTLGYEPLEVPDVRVTSGRPSVVTLELREQAIALQGVQVGGTAFIRRDEAPLSVTRLTVDEIRRTAGAQTDLSRTLLSLPGVLSGVDNRNDLLVRGGGPGENGYWLDGIRLPRINHFETQGIGGGALGLLNVEFIESTDFYAGGFPARYGDALSSTLVIRNRSGDPDRLRGDLTIGASEAGLTLDGPLGRQGNVLFSLRRSYLQFLFELLDLPIRPAYWDAQLRAEWRPDARNRLVFVSVGAIDELDLVPPKDGDLASIEVANQALGNDQWGFTSGLVWQRSVAAGTVRASVSQSVDDFRFEGREATSKDVYLSNDSREWERRLQLDSDLRIASGLTLALGAEGVRQGIRTAFFDAGGPGRTLRSPLAFEGESGWWAGAAWAQLSGALLPQALVGDRKGLDGDRISGTLGLRAQAHEALAGGVRISPRWGLRAQVTPTWDLGVGGGSFLQPPSRLALSVRNPSGAPVNEGLPYSEARHLLMGVGWNPAPGFRLRVEAFHKAYAAIPRSATDPRIVLPNEGGDFGFVGAEPLVGDGEGRARGLEVLAQRQGVGRAYGIAAWTLSSSEFRSPEAAGGSWRPSAWDARHSVSLTGGVRLGEGDRWEVGTRWRFVSGRPFTPFDPVASAEAFPRTGAGVRDLDRLNEARTPAYHRLDLRVDRKLRFGGVAGRIYFDVQNVYNRENLYGFTWTEAPEFPEGLRPRNEIGLLPTVGFTVEW